MLKTFFFLLILALFEGSDSYVLTLSKTNDLCQDSQTWDNENYLLGENQDEFETNDKLYCSSTDLFLLSDGVIEVDIYVYSPGESDILSVIVYKISESRDIIVAKKDIYLSKTSNEGIRIIINITSDISPGYVLLQSRQSKMSQTYVKTVQFIPANIANYIDSHDLEERSKDRNVITKPFQTTSPLPTENVDVTNPIVTVPFPTVGEIITPVPDTTVVTVPFPTIGILPTTERTTIVTIPFPTIGDLVTADDTTIDPVTIITVPFPTVGEIVPPSITTQDPADITITLVTVPFPTVSDIGTLEPLTSTTTDSIDSIESTEFPDDAEEATGMSVLAIVMTTVGSVIFVVLAAFLLWYLLAARKSAVVTPNV